ncbi:MAG: phosphoenolpyruvate--protein phosphotransferase, partial [Desulfuromonadales bacterium]|nr:phosphoenolpyruvate--protein phosphotransferase [Desulfuromonadales bacterium]
THLMILEDRSFIKKLQKEITNGHSAAYALEKTVADYIEVFRKMEDPYLRERASDMEDIGRRILANLVGDTPGQTLHLKHPGILVARQILPSDMASLDNEQILGIITEVGEKNAHAVIMAKSMGIPAIVAVRGALKYIAPEDNLIIDANTGRIYINPVETVKDEYQRLQLDQTRELCRLDEYRDQPATTSDGERIILRANIGLISDINVAKRFGAEGVGLYRTEFPYMARGDFPSRNDQYELYSRVVKDFAGHPVTIRTLDIGGDKFLSYLDYSGEDNPYLGWRSIRVSLELDDIFREQIRAVLRASAFGNVKLMFPMITSVGEVKKIILILDEEKNRLKKGGVQFDETIKAGIMIEVPAAVNILNKLLSYVDFVSIGTNDLIQYTLAVDRNNPKVASLYNPLHPAVIMTVSEIVSVCKEKGKEVGICGEAAFNPKCAYLFLGMGIDRLSMNPSSIPLIKELIMKMKRSDGEVALKKVLDMGDETEISDYLEKEMEDIIFM